MTKLPWGSLNAADYPPVVVDGARRVWTEIALNEYRAAAAFASLLREMLEARVPLDIVGMASEFVADEVSHSEMASRVAMELGGAVPIELDTAKLLPELTSGLTPLQRSNEQALRVAVISETISAAIATGTLRVASHPLLRAIEELVVRDEAHHMRLGTIYFEWAADLLEPAERARLGLVAMDAIEKLSAFWTARSPEPPEPSPAPRLTGHALWMDAATFRARVVGAVRDDLLPKLDRIGILLPESGLEGLHSTF